MADYEKRKVIIFGDGNIGNALKKEALKVGYSGVSINSRGVIHADGIQHGYVVEFGRRGNVGEMLAFLEHQPVRPKLAFLAIPSGGDGATELAIIKYFVIRGIPVVTAGKSAFANRYDDLVQDLPLIGRRATVGGATGILPFLKGWLDFGKPFVIDLVINGTMSSVMTDVWGGRSIESAIDEAIKLKYAEPPPEGNEPSPLAIMGGECEDVVKKLAIICNDVFSAYMGRTFVPGDLQLVPLTGEYLDQVTAQNARMKYIVRIATTYRPLIGLDPNNPGSITGLFQLGNGHRLVINGGFCNTPRGSPLDGWVPNDGPGNAGRIDQGGIPTLILGEGAGPRATVGAMLKDAFELCPPH